MKRSIFVFCAAAAVALVGLPIAAHGPSQPPGHLNLVEATIPDLQHALQSHRVTSEALVREYLKRITAYDESGPALNSFLTINPHAIEEARARDEARRHGRVRGPLDGIPVLLKDNIDTAGMQTTAGSVALEGSVPPDDAFITAKLRDAGAIILGKATLTEFANFLTNGMPAGYSSLGGYGFNPYDPRPLPGGDGRPVLSPGGSSSGPGIAVSANLVTVAIGTETSGSILSPASQDGDVGIKPTLGLVSRDGIVPITADQDTAGPLARSVTDAAILLGQIAGFDPSDPATTPCLTPGNCFQDYTQFLDRHALRGARIAVPHDPYWNGLSADQQQIMEDTIATLRAQGAFVDDGHEIPTQAALSAFGTCGEYPAPPDCSTVLLYGFKRDLNSYLLSLGPAAPVHSLSDVIAFNNAHAAVALKYGQTLALAADQMDTAPGSADTQRYSSDRMEDLALARGGLDTVYAGPDGVAGTQDDFDAILFPSNRGANIAARAGYPSVEVVGGFLAPHDEVINPAPYGVTFSGPAFSEPRLIGLAYALEQITHERVPPPTTPPLPGDSLGSGTHHP
jgi:amidase